MADQFLLFSKTVVFTLFIFDNDFIDRRNTCSVAKADMSISMT